MCEGEREAILGGMVQRAVVSPAKVLLEQNPDTYGCWDGPGQATQPS